MSSSSHDQADKLELVTLPIPTEQRVDIFVVTGTPEEATYEWVKQTGTSTFHFGVNVLGEPASFCGVCLFVVNQWGYVTDLTWKQVEPFFRRAGSEANVFEFSRISKHFTRRDREWFLAHIAPTPPTEKPS